MKTIKIPIKCIDQSIELRPIPGKDEVQVFKYYSPGNGEEVMRFKLSDLKNDLNQEEQADHDNSI